MFVCPRVSLTFCFASVPFVLVFKNVLVQRGPDFETQFTRTSWAQIDTNLAFQFNSSNSQPFVAINDADTHPDNDETCFSTLHNNGPLS